MIKNQYDNVTCYFTTYKPGEIAFTCKDLGFNFNFAKLYISLILNFGMCLYENSI